MQIMPQWDNNIFEKDNVINISDDLDWGNEGYDDQFDDCKTLFGSP